MNVREVQVAVITEADPAGRIVRRRMVAVGDDGAVSSGDMENCPLTTRGIAPL